MDFLGGMIRGEMSRNDPVRVFDWDKAAWLIRSTNAQTASAGLRDDWEYTGGLIYSAGQPVPAEDTYTFLSSTWAIPELNLDGEVMPCWRWQSDVPDWDHDTYWPDSAREIVSRPQLVASVEES